ncbi:MAG: tRNA pseudouridine(38-40) synthase TruA [Campylobacterales bacterium]
MQAKVTIAYDGSHFYGSQLLREKGDTTLPTVLSVFEEALKSMGIASAVSAAGRTDRFVHATGQVVGFEVPPFWQNADRLKSELDKKLWPQILIRRLELVDDGFHPRFCAQSRAYRYLITTDRPSVFATRYVTFAPVFDADRAALAIKAFEGQRDFYHFSKRGSDEKTTVRTLRKTALYRHKNLFVARFEGDAFLRSQIRLMMAAVLRVAARQAEVDDIAWQFSGERIRFRTPAPAAGLYLAQVRY